MEDKRPLQSIPDDELLLRLSQLMSQSRRVEADIVAHIAEVEERRLYAREAFPSMFVYCMDVLHLSEAEAYLRIWASRASRKHPMLLTMLADGRLHLTAIVMLAPHLTGENRAGLLARATHLSKRQIAELIAEIAPRPDVPMVVRKLPERRRPSMAGFLGVPSRGERPMLDLGPDPTLEHRPDRVPSDGVAVSPAWPSHAPAVALDVSTVAALPGASAPPVLPLTIASVWSPAVASRVSAPVVQPLSPGRYKVQFTASAEFHDKLEKLRALMGSRGPNCDLAAVIEQAVTEKLERLEARRFARTSAPRKADADTDADTGANTEAGSTRRPPPATSPRPSGVP